MRNLEKESETCSLEGTSGIAHTRWATHGKPCDVNSHPHATSTRSIAVVHNGIVENFSTLKKGLQDKGYVFLSETDTELLAHLAQDMRNQMPDATLAEVVAACLQVVRGAYGVVFLFEEDPDVLIGARRGSPLILGVGNGEHMLASDASAIIEHTQDVVYLRDGELVEVHKDSYQIHNVSDMHAVDNVVVHLEMNLEQIERGGYKHFMLKEIMDQPNALRNTMRGRLYHPKMTTTNSTPREGEEAEDMGVWKILLGGLERTPDGSPPGTPTAIERMASAKRIICCACGTSWHSALIAKYTIEHLARVPVEVEYASEFRYRRPNISEQDVIIAISQSGETADTLEAIKIAKEKGALTVGVVNGVGSSIARETGAGVYLHSGPEIGVASTKAFTGQVCVLLLIALRLAVHKGTIDTALVDEYCDALDSVPQILEKWLQNIEDQVKFVSKYLRLADHFLFFGSGVEFPVALEGALKLKEISYIHAEGFPSAEMRHSAVALVSSFMPVVMVAMRSDPAYHCIVEHSRALQAKHAALIVLTDEGNTDFEDIASFTLYCPSLQRFVEPLVTVLPLQLLSYHIADMRGCGIDQPRNLAKSVTVE